MRNKEIYYFFPSGILHALTKIGGLLALLKISILLSYLHKYWFEKEINKSISKNKISADGDKKDEQPTEV
jgi:hypothetical protein